MYEFFNCFCKKLKIKQLKLPYPIVKDSRKVSLKKYKIKQIDIFYSF